MSTLIALDPSINSAGVAAFDRGTAKLLAATRIKASKGITTKHDTLMRCADIATNAVEWIADLVRDGMRRPTRFISEWPVQYSAGQAKGDRNDLTPMAGVAGALAVLLRTDPRTLTPGSSARLEIASVVPSDWVQGTKKPKGGGSWAAYKESTRGYLVLRYLSEAEALIYHGVKSHDSGDAIGIGMHDLGRLKHKRVISRS